MDAIVGFLVQLAIWAAIAVGALIGIISGIGKAGAPSRARGRSRRRRSAGLGRAAASGLIAGVSRRKW